MIGESIAAGLIANGLSSTFGLASSVLLNRIRRDEVSVNTHFNKIFTDEISKEIQDNPNVKELAPEEFETVYDTVNELSSETTIPDSERVLTTIADGLFITLEGEIDSNETEAMVNSAYDRSITRLVSEIAGTETGDALLINSLLETNKSVSNIQEEIKSYQQDRIQASTFRKINLDGDEIENPLNTLLGQPSSENQTAYVSRTEVPDVDSSEWFLIVGRKGLGKTRTLAELATQITAKTQIDHVISPKRGFQTPKDVERLIQDGIEGDTLIIWDDIQDLGVDSIEETLRQTLFKLQDYLNERGNRLLVIASVQADAIPNLSLYQAGTDTLWEKFEPVELEPLSEKKIQILIDQLAREYDLEFDDSVFDRLTMKVSHADASPMYAESAVAQLSQWTNSPDIRHVENIESNAVEIWQNLYADLRRNHPDARFILWGMSLLQMGAIPPYEPTLRELFVELFDRDRFTFEDSLDVLIEKQWITRSERTWNNSDKPIYQSHDLQMDAVDEDNSRIIGEYSKLLRGRLEETIPDADSDWLPHYHCNTALFFSLEFIDGAEKFADEHFERAIQLAPLSPVLRLNYGEILLARGQTEKAINQYEAGLSMAPEWPALRHSYAFTLDKLNKNLEAEREYRKVLDIAPAHQPSRVNLAQLLSEVGKFCEAKNQFEQTIEQGYIDSDVYNNFGVLCQNTGEVRRAERLFRDGLEMNPDSTALRNNLAGLLFKTRQPAAAKEILKPAVENTGEVSPDVYYKYAMILSEVGEQDKSEHYLDLYESVAEAALSESERQTVLSSAHSLDEYESLPTGFKYADYLRDEGFYKEAKQEYLNILDDGYESAEIYLQLAETSIKLGNTDAAHGYFESAYVAEPDEVSVLLQYGNFLKHQGEYEQAISHFETSIKTVDDVRLQIDYALCLLEAERFDEAEQEFQSIIGSATDETQDLHRAHHNYGNLLILTGREELAKQEFNEALRLKPAYPAAKVGLGQLIADESPERGAELLESGSRGLLGDGNTDDGLVAFQQAVEAYESAGQNETVVKLCNEILDRLSSITHPDAMMYWQHFQSKREAAQTAMAE